MGCSRLSDLLRYLHAKQCFYTMSYIDDLLGAELPSKAENSFKYMVKLLQDLNIPISEFKLTPPSTIITCLGIEFNLVEASLSIPITKLNEILQECQKFKQRTQFARKQLQSIIGKLMFVHKVVKPARLFVNRLLNTLRNMGDKCPMSIDVKKDITWFCEFVK